MAIILAMMIACVLLLPNHNLKADVVLLHGGKQVQCESAWEEGTEVKCRIGQGTVTLSKSVVSKIVKAPPSAKQNPESGTPQKPRSNDAAQPRPEASTPDATNRLEQARLYTAEGVILSKKKDYSAAIESFRKAYDLQKNKNTVWNLASAYYLAEDYENAETYFIEFLSISPNDTRAMNALGLVALRKGDADAAEDYWQRSYDIKPDPAILEMLEHVRNDPQAPTGATLSPEEMEKTIAAYDEDTDTHFHIRYDGGTVNPALLREISRFLEDSYDSLSSELDVEPSNTLEVILYPKKDFLSITGAPDWSSGFNDGKIHLPVGGILSINERVQARIMHELTHSFLNVKAGGCPAWLQEGLAQYMEGKRINSAENETLSALLAQQQLPSLRKLTPSFFNAKDEQVAVLYTGALSFIEYLVGRYRFYEINDLLANLGNGQSIGQAFFQAFGVELTEAEEEWHQVLAIPQ